MISGKIIERFKLDGKEVVFRYPRFEDVDQMLKWVNNYNGLRPSRNYSNHSACEKVSESKNLYCNWWFPLTR